VHVQSCFDTTPHMKHNTITSHIQQNSEQQTLHCCSCSGVFGLLISQCTNFLFAESSVPSPPLPLLQVGTVYSSDNVWANIQDSGHPWDISWHLGDASAWKPFFGPVLP
jgi:hypothetical protein